MAKKVVVIGGGIAGMSAAHELIKKGFEVEVYEARSIPGGKARSVRVLGSGKDGRKDLPGEHGFRFFPGFYQNLPKTMKEIRINRTNRTAFDNLVQGTRELIARAGNTPNILALARFPRNLKGLKLLFAELTEPVGLTEEEKQFAAERMWQIATSSDARIENDYERLSWWEFVEADRFSDNYRALFAVGFTRTLVGARAKSASTRVGGTIVLQLLYGALKPGSSTDRLLNGPTNDTWIDPWLSYLRSRGVKYFLKSPISSLCCDEQGNIDHIIVSQAGGVRDNDELQVKGDYYICAVPVEVAAKLLTAEIINHDETLSTIQKLADDATWMNGMQLYLSQDVKIDHGHTMYVDSPWALTSVSQLQFWPEFNVSEHGDGKVKGILSIDISEWDELGILDHGLEGDRRKKTAKECTREEIKDEVWAQIRQSLNKPGQPEVLHENSLIDWYLDGDIEPRDIFDSAGNMSTTSDSLYVNLEPLLVNKINTWDLRPETHTHIPNLFLASDYVKTDVSLATMEGANEAARRAVNGIIDASGEGKPYCKIYPLSRPWVLAPFRWVDESRYKIGLPWQEHHSIFDAIKGLFSHILGR
jgi:15-cis-phytoene desaturase